MIETDKKKKIFKLMGLDKLKNEAQENAKKLMQQMVVHKKSGPEKEQMYLYLMEQFCSGIGANHLDKEGQIKFREILDTIITVEAFGLDKVKSPHKIVIVLDHIVPAASEKYAQNHKDRSTNGTT